MRNPLRSRDRTQPWQGGYAAYDLIKELVLAVLVITLLAVLLTILFSSPDEPPSTLAQWSRKLPVDFTKTAVAQLGGTSGTAEYGPPYNHNAKGQHAAFLYPQKWLGVSHPINTANDFVIEPLKTIPNDPALQSAIARYEAAPEATKKAWTDAYAEPLEEYEKAKEENKPPPKAVAENAAQGTVSVTTSKDAGPVPAMMASLLSLAQSGGLDGSLLTSRQFYQTDYTKPLLFLADGKRLEERAEANHLLGEQWGMMNETGSYPGQAWLWLYALWYQIEPFKASENADILVMLVMTVLSLALVCIPFLPIIRSIPRWIPIHRLIWREHYRAQAG